MRVRSATCQGDQAHWPVERWTSPPPGSYTSAPLTTPDAVTIAIDLLRKGGAPHLPEKADSDEACDVAVGPEAGFPLEELGEILNPNTVTVRRGACLTRLEEAQTWE